MSPEPTPPEAPTPPKRARRSLLRRFLKGVWLVVLVLPVAGLLGIAVAASRAPVPLPGPAVSWLEERANLRLDTSGARLRLDYVALGFDSAASAFGLVLRNATLQGGGTGGARIELPSLHVSLDAGAALSGQISARRVTFEDATLRLSRQLDGRVTLGFGEERADQGRLPESVPEALAWLDRALEDPRLATLERFEAWNITVILENLRQGRRARMTSGYFTFDTSTDTQALTASAEFGQLGGAAWLSARRHAGQDIRVGLELDDLGSTAIADLLAPDHALATLGSALSGGLEGRVAADGSLRALDGVLELGPGRLPTTLPLAFDRAALALSWDPAGGRVVLPEVVFSSDVFRVVSRGQVFVSGALGGDQSVAAQMQLQTLEIDPEGLEGGPFVFDEGLLEAQVRLAPLAIDIGQAMIGYRGQRMRARGALALEDNLLRGALDLTAAQIDAPTLMTLWPEALIPKTRRWATENIEAGTITDFAAALRPGAPGQPPEVSASFGVQDARVRFMRFLPMAEEAHGAGVLHDNRLSLRVDAARVPSGFGGDVALDGTVITIPDIRIKPAPGEIDLELSGAIGDVLQLLDNRPFHVLERSGRSADLATGQARVSGRIETILRKGVQLPDVTFDLAGRLRGMSSGQIVPGRALRAAVLDIAINNTDGVVISGPVDMDGVALDVTWRQPIVPKGAPPAPAQLEGRAALSADSLAALGIDLGPGSVRGQGRAQFRMTLERDVPGVLEISSDLRGLGLRFPALAFSKAPNAAGAFDARVPLRGAGAGIGTIDLSLSAPGLDLDGSVQVREGGGLARADLRRLRVGDWLNTGVTLEGRGRGTPPAITLNGGSADLRRYQAATRGQGGGGGGGRITLALDRVVVSDQITLRDVSGRIEGGAGGIGGQVRGMVNGAAPVQATLVGTAAGPMVRVVSENAGRLMAAAGVFRNGAGGTFDLTLRPTGARGSYDGALSITNLRVRNAPALAALLSAVSVVGLLEQLGGEGLFFSEVDADFLMRPSEIVVRRSSATGPSMAITAEGLYYPASQQLDFQGVVSPLYFVNGLFGALFAGRRDEGLIGLTYTLRGSAASPGVQVNPLSALTPGIFREIFRRPAPEPSQ